MPRPRPCPDPCHVLLIGGGGREHALAWKLSQSPRLGTLWRTDTANAGLATFGRPVPAEVVERGLFHYGRWCERNDIHLVSVGPEVPLEAGIADELSSPGRLVFGPGREGARIESDKAFAKSLMRHEVMAN